MREAGTSSGPFQYRHDEDEGNGQVNGQQMKAADELRQGGALDSIRGKESEQCGQQQNESEREKTKAQPPRRPAKRKCRFSREPRLTALSAPDNVQITILAAAALGGLGGRRRTGPQ